MREPVLSVSACVEQDEPSNTTIAPFQIFDLSGAKISISHSVLDTESVNADFSSCHAEPRFSILSTLNFSFNDLGTALNIFHTHRNSLDYFANACNDNSFRHSEPLGDESHASLVRDLSLSLNMTIPSHAEPRFSILPTLN